jgi:DNA-binding NarL/FixJ family response regulator
VTARSDLNTGRDAEDDRIRRHVLIVDDHRSFRAWARALLEHEGYVVVGEAVDGSSALAAVEALRPDVVLLDIRLPDIDGFTVARRLRDPGVEGPAVVLVSTRDAVDYGDRLADCGARGFIAKADLSAQALAVVLRPPTGDANDPCNA